MASDPVDNPIDVLLADDDQEWAQFTAAEMETAATDLSVDVVDSGEAALEKLRGETTYDCLLVDYQMPGMDGIEVLRSIRDTHGDLPFLLVTGSGSEDVAADAIGQNVTDYLVKDPLENQGAEFASRIERAVETHRLRRALEESERRYRTVVEQSHDAMAILRNGRLVFSNERLGDLTGRPPDDLYGTPLVELIHPEDRSRIEDVLAGSADVDRAETTKFDARVLQGSDAVRECEFNCTGITYDAAPAMLCSIRDVTVRKRRERERERALNLSRAVQDIAVHARTRDEVEMAFCRRLLEEPGRRFAWTGAIEDGGRLEPRVVAGPDDRYLDRVDLDPDQPSPPPSVAASTRREPQFVTDVEDRAESAWRDRLLEGDIRSVAALPLVHDDIGYGVLAVYATEPGAFDGSDGELLSDLSETLASSIARAELRTALTTDRVVEVELQLTGEKYYLIPVARALADDGGSDVPIEVLETLPDEETGVRQFVSVAFDDRERLRSLLADRPEVQSIEFVDMDGEKVLVRLHVGGETPEALLGDHGGAVRSTHVDSRRATVVVEFAQNKDVRKVVETLEAAFGSVTVQRYRKREAEHDVDTLLDRCDLTDKQDAALRTAYRYGYFEDTRQHYAEEIAEALDVSRPTFQRHLRVAERKVLAELFDEDVQRRSQ